MSGFNVLEMANDYAKLNDMDVDDLFKKSDPIEEQPEEQSLEDMAMDIEEPVATEPVKKGWTPDASIMAEMEEFQQDSVVYNKDDIQVGEEPLQNGLEDSARKASVEAMDELHRTEANIEDAKKRHGIIKFQIPEGQFHAAITAAAGDTNYDRAQEKLDQLFDEIETDYPEFILEYAEGFGNVNKVNLETTETGVNFDDQIQNEDGISKSDEDEVKVVIDKSNVSEISWTSEEMDKIKKSRTVNLNIVESVDLEYNNIEDVSDDLVNSVLMQYQRKANDITTPLPASKYRATFVGLTYPEVIDLSNSNEMNNLDGERKKWAICFDHIRNQSIGPWEEYTRWTDPETGEEVRSYYTAECPDGVDEKTFLRVSKFDDFLMKTSFLDLEFMLWKILCATTLDKEIISIDCHAIQPSGKECGHTYDWIYSPADLWQIQNMNQQVLDEMKEVGDASTVDEIKALYKSSMLNTKNVVKLVTSGYSVVFGHVSAYEYLNNLYSKIKELEDSDEDPEFASKGLNYTILTVVKAFLIPKKDGNGYYRITGTDNLLKVINRLDEIDWQTLSEIVRLMMNPYQLRFALTNIVCPKCKNKSSIPIESMTQLLFIVARSLSSVSVELKRT